MKIEEVRKLIRLVEESNIGELEVRKWWGAIRISRHSASGNGVVVSGHLPAELARMAPAPASTPSSAAAPAEADGDRRGPADTAGLTPVTSPMVGTFYRAPAPDADPYVEPGDRIEPGQTLCIIEAMKLMNEIQSEVRGKVVKVLVSNSQPVEFGQTLFLVDESA
jgi:acetyl-CoA carboxylase biotin carboxyl carrier protein